MKYDVRSGGFTMVKSILAFSIVLVSWQAFAGVSEPAEMLRGFRSADGHVLVEMNSKNFPAGNVFFLGDAKKLNQLELTWDDSHNDERVVTYVANEGDDPSEITLTPAGARVENGLRVGHPHVDEMTPMTVSQLKSLSKAALRILPLLWKSKYLFQSAVSGEYILVKEPVFNFHGNSRVMMGPLNDLKEIAVQVSENWKEGVAGNIQFAAGGGVFIPKMSELLSTLRPTQAEMPTLVRSNSSSFEILKVPKLSATQLARLGFVRERNDVLSAAR
jgi:hypothetical protein